MESLQDKINDWKRQCEVSEQYDMFVDTSTVREIIKTLEQNQDDQARIIKIAENRLKEIRKLQREIEQLKMDKEDMYQLATRQHFDINDWKDFQRIFNK